MFRTFCPMPFKICQNKPKFLLKYIVNPFKMPKVFWRCTKVAKFHQIWFHCVWSSSHDDSPVRRFRQIWQNVWSHLRWRQWQLEGCVEVMLLLLGTVYNLQTFNYIITCSSGLAENGIGLSRKQISVSIIIILQIVFAKFQNYFTICFCIANF